MKPWFSGYLFASVPYFSSKSAFYLFGHLAHHQTTKCLGSTFASRVTAHDQGPQQSACRILFASWLAKSEQVIKPVKLKSLITKRLFFPRWNLNLNFVGCSRYSHPASQWSLRTQQHTERRRWSEPQISLVDAGPSALRFFIYVSRHISQVVLSWAVRHL